MKTDAGEVEIEIPRDREGTFEPQLALALTMEGEKELLAHRLP